MGNQVHLALRYLILVQGPEEHIWPGPDRRLSDFQCFQALQENYHSMTQHGQRELGYRSCCSTWTLGPGGLQGDGGDTRRTLGPGGPPGDGGDTVGCTGRWLISIRTIVWVQGIVNRWIPVPTHLFNILILSLFDFCFFPLDIRSVYMLRRQKSGWIFFPIFFFLILSKKA